ncbi:MAG: prefoldin subunit alpha [Nanoarchaeota archaeon]|nr:prefoldin subunit alpha [Nanoarchaeota archaeon]
MNKEELQQRFQELQLLSSQLKQVQQQIGLFNQQAEELKKIKASVEEIEAKTENTEILAPLGAGIYIKAKLQKPKEVIMNVGNNVTVQKSTEDAKTIIHGQIKEIESIIGEMRLEFERGAVRAQHLQIEIQKSVAQKAEK